MFMIIGKKAYNIIAENDMRPEYDLVPLRHQIHLCGSDYHVRERGWWNAIALRHWRP